MNNYTILYVLAIVTAVIGGSALIQYLRYKKLIKDNDITTTLSALGLTMSVINEITKNNNEEVKKLSQVLLATAEYINGSTVSLDREGVIQYTQNIANICNLTITSEMLILINKFVDTALERIAPYEIEVDDSTKK